MRVSIKKALQWVCSLTLLQIVVYYWATKKDKTPIVNIQLQRFLEPLGWDEGICATKHCPRVKNDMINVHLIPHSHIDVGWVKNVDQYYVGQDVSNVWATGCVKCTFNGTITELMKNSSRRFIFVEMKYLARYWDELDEWQRSVLVQLIKARRIEITSGGWVSSDAAVTMYNDIIDQHTLGFDFIREKFGSCAQPRTGWHVDQFGHSREHAAIFAQMGFDSLFIGRIDSQDLLQRKAKKHLEFMWNTSPINLKERSTLFTHIIFDGYYAPSSYNFETDRITWTDENFAKRAAENFISVINERAKSAQTNHILIPMGCDFGYKDQAAAAWFINMDSLMKAVDQQQKETNTVRYNLLYSTPSCYTYHVNKANVTLPVKNDDFHPYGIETGAYWTGYFTTRGGFKMHIKKAGQILQSCKQLSIFTELDDMFNHVNKLRDALAVMQHHDAITGTQTLAVLKDYNLLLSEAVEHCERVMSSAYLKLWNLSNKGRTTNPILTSRFCHDLNISACDISEGSRKFLISFYNPLSWSVDVYVRLPVKADKVTVIDAEKVHIPVQIVPVPEGIKKIPERNSTAETEAVFQIYIPPMTATSFKVTQEIDAEKPKPEPLHHDEIVIENKHLALKFNISSGKLQSIYNKDRQIGENLHQDFAFYKAGEYMQRTSGAYLFVPVPVRAEEITPGKVEIKVFKGDIVQEVHQKFSNWVSQIVRVYKEAKFAEFQWIVGPIENNVGKEIISRFTSSMESGTKFYTDSNGREIIQRIRKPVSRNDTFFFDGISGNYYPVTSRIFIRDVDNKNQLTILPDRPQGGSSLESGSIELMVHRHLLSDDNLGLAEPLQDVGVDGAGIIFTGKHYLHFDSVIGAARTTRRMAQQLHLGPVPMFTPLNSDSAIGGIPKQHTFLSAPLPNGVQILTLDRISLAEANFFLLRLEHMLEEKDDILLSVPVTVQLETLFVPFTILAAEETTLGGNFRPLDINRYKWDTVMGNTQSSIMSPHYTSVMEAPFNIIIEPMEIRTFHVQVVWSKSFK